MDQFEVFTKSLVAVQRDPFLTVQKRGTITLNASAFAGLGEPAAVELLFDRNDLVLGMRPCEPNVDHAVFVRPASKAANGPFVISAMAFLRYYEIDTTEARRYPAPVENGLLRAELTGPFEVVSKSVSPAR